MKLGSLLVVLAVAASAPAAQIAANSAYTVGAVIGTGSRGDGGPAPAALLDGPFGLAEDSAGNIYISESNNGVIRRVKPDGTIERFAGTGTKNDGPAGSPATATDLVAPAFLLIDKDGGLIFSDSYTCRIRKVQTDGTIAEVAGTGRCASNSSSRFGGSSNSVADGNAFEIDLTPVGGMVLDNTGHLVFSEPYKHIVRRLGSDGQLVRIAGTGTGGYSADALDATGANLYYPTGLTLDPNGFLLISDSYNCRIRQLDDSGVLNNVLGATTCAKSTITPSGGTTTALARVGPIAYDAATNALYIGIPESYRVIRYDYGTQRFAPWLGSGKNGASNSTDPLRLTLNDMSTLLVSQKLGVLVAADTSFQVYQVKDGTVQDFAGHWPLPGGDPNGPPADLLEPTGTWPASDGSILIADNGSNRILRWSSDQPLTAIAGMSYPTDLTSGADGQALAVTINQPNRVIQRKNGDIFISDSTRIRAIDSTGAIRTIRSGVSNPVGMVFDSQDRLVYAESNQHRIVRLDLTNNSYSVIAGTGTAGFYGDGAAATSALLNTPTDLAYDSKGNLWIADSANHRVRVLTAADGNIQTVIGSGFPLSYGNINGAKALDTGFDVIGLAIDAQDNVYVSEGVRIDQIAPDGTIKVVTGFLSQDDDGTNRYIDGPLNGAAGISVDAKGQIYIPVSNQGQVLTAAPRSNSTGLHRSPRPHAPGPASAGE